MSEPVEVMPTAIVPDLRSDSAQARLLGEYLVHLSGGRLRGCLDRISEENVVHEAASLPWGGDWGGHGGFIDLVKRLNSGVTTELLDAVVDDCGRFVVVSMTARFTSSASGESLLMPVREFYTVRDRLIVDVDVFYQDTLAVNRLLGHEA